MAPTLVKMPTDEWDSLRKIREARDFYEAHLDDLRAMKHRYIVLRGEDIVATSDDPDDAWAQVLKARLPVTECLLVHVPQEGESYFY